MVAATKRVSTDVDPFSPESRSNPYRFHERLRELGPVVWLERYGVWACPRYDEVKTVLADPQTFCSGAGVGLSNLRHEEHWRKPSILLENDPPNHTRVRGALMKVLTPKTIRNLRADLEPKAVTIVDRVLSAGTVDGVDDFALPFPLKAFPDSVGLVEEGREALLAYGRMVFDGMGPRNEIYEDVMANAESVMTWINRQCRRDALRPGGLGAQVHAMVDEGKLSNEEAVLTVRSFLSAGVDTTIDALGSTLYCLAQHPDQWALVRQDPSKVRQLFEEVLRFESPFQMFFRTTTTDVELGGVRIGTDEKVLVMPGSANRDPRQWEDPDRFDIDRKPVGHLGFGAGIHTCVGQMIARLEAEVLLTEFVRRVESIEIVGEPAWRPSNTLRGLSTLPLAVRPSRDTK